MANLTPTQLQDLQTDITVTRASVNLTDHEGITKTALTWYTEGNNGIFIENYNKQATPPVFIWRRNIPRQEIASRINVTEYIAASLGRQNFINFILLGPEIINATDSAILSQFNAVFSAIPAMSTTNADVAAIAKRPATFLEALFTTPLAGAFVSAVQGELLTLANMLEVRAL